MTQPPESLQDACSTNEYVKAAIALPIADSLAIERASRLFRALGEPSRLRMLARLAGGEMCVTDLANAENEDLSTISQRLRVLRAENLVVRRRRGKHINYALADQHITELVSNVLAHASEPLRNEPEN